ncbi:MAG: IS66 family insertion sequence element accessory protein TnpA [Bryobacteraceae bacterium]
MHEESGSVTRRRRSGSEITRLVSEFLASGLSVAEFCRRRELARGTLVRHLKRLSQCPNQDQPPQRWVRLQVARSGDTPALAAASGLVLILTGGRRIGLARGFDPATLRQLLSLLESLGRCSPGQRPRAFTWRWGPPICARVLMGSMRWLHSGWRWIP